MSNDQWHRSKLPSGWSTGQSQGRLNRSQSPIERFKCSLTCSFVALYWLQPVKWPSIAATKGALMVVGRLIGGSTNWVLKSEATYKGGEACLQASTDMDGRCKLGGALPSWFEGLSSQQFRQQVYNVRPILNQSKSMVRYLCVFP